jgi:hypothetical protein
MKYIYLFVILSGLIILPLISNLAFILKLSIIELVIPDSFISYKFSLPAETHKCDVMFGLSRIQ